MKKFVILITLVLMTLTACNSGPSPEQLPVEDRPYTVFSAHTHVYDYEKRDGRDYITTSTSGGINFTRPGSMDHVIWVTMGHEGPKIVNLLMNGIMDKHGPPKDYSLEEIGLYRLKKA